MSKKLQALLAKSAGLRVIEREIQLTVDEALSENRTYPVAHAEAKKAIALLESVGIDDYEYDPEAQRLFVTARPQLLEEFEADLATPDFEEECEDIKRELANLKAELEEGYRYLDRIAEEALAKYKPL